MNGYNDIPFMKFAFGLFIIALPAIIMAESGHSDYLWGYVVLILISFLVYQYKGVSTFAAFVQNA